ncbi:MAG: FAD-binding oxidoreductase [Actinobacteria bacterium]|nr:FAD-binding oxidoreductase [Actinomycetota bacterium]MBU1944338.1 FAD-binding oxidoreductase [Actinomycetota bacterium]MBU2688323.1 FAD-binding oxidoreductase [Actinomycetota bacterium]
MAVKAVEDLKERLAGIVGETSVNDDRNDLLQYARPDGDGHLPTCVVRPVNPEQVTALVVLANETGLNLVPVSSGPPHARGGTAPESGAVMVDLSAMDRIVRMDRRNKVAIVEPGVTFGRLASEASKVGLKALMPLLPRQRKSVLASYLEREPIIIPKYHWDATDPLLCMEVVFGTGDMFRTGSAAGPGSLEQQWEHGEAQKNPMGPGQTDFGRLVQGAQGTMGIVTWGSVKLEVMPSEHRIYFVNDSLERLIEFAYPVLRRKMADEFLILDGTAFATTMRGGAAEIGDLAGRIPGYVLVLGISGYEYFPGERVTYLVNDMADLAKEAGVALTRSAAGVDHLEAERALSGPSGEPYYKHRMKGGSRDLFFLTTLDRVPAFTAAMESLAQEHGHPVGEIGTYIQPIQHGRTVHLEFDIYFDPGSAKDAARAGGLFSAAAKACQEMGGFFSRPYGPWADMAFEACPDTVDALLKVKRVLDPRGVMNRNKLCFKEA